MRICSVEGCICGVFGKGLCIRHWKEKFQKPIPTTLKKHPKLSYKRTKQVNRYNSLIKRLDASNETPKCFFCNLPIVGRVDHHHTVGKDGEKLTDEKYIVIAHRECHTRWHNLSVCILSNEQWWNSYIERLRMLSEKEYQKTLNKFNK